MKKILLSLIITIFLLNPGFSQVPEAFSYQAVVRTSTGDIVANTNVSFRISILQNSETGSAVYVETHSALTNDFGLANLKIGTGTVESGIFDPGGWGIASHFIKIELDPSDGTSYTHIGTSQLLSVPYAFHAQTVEDDQVDDADADASNEFQTIDLNGSQLTLSDGGGTVNLPTEAASPWENSTVGIQYNSGKVGIGHDPADDTGKLQIWGDNTLSIEAVNNSATYPTMYIQNQSGDAAYFDGPITIEDGTEGAGKILTSDADGNASWQTSAAATSIWENDNDNIYFNTGKVGIGKIPGADLRQFQVKTTNMQAIAAENNSTYPSLYLKNLGSGPAAELRNPIKIIDGTEGDGKVLTSNANGLASWQDPSTGLWTQNGAEIYFNNNVGIGISNPMFKLDVSSSTGETYSRIQSTTSNASLIVERGGSSSGASIIYKTGGALSFHTGLLSSSSYKISTTNPILNGLEVEIDGDVKLSDELHSTATGAANMMPVAYGTIDYGGAVLTGSGNFTVSKTATGKYDITISGESYSYTSYVTTVASISPIGFIKTGSMGGKLIVLTYDTSAVAKDMFFSFVVYQP